MLALADSLALLEAERKKIILPRFAKTKAIQDRFITVLQGIVKDGMQGVHEELAGKLKEAIAAKVYWNKDEWRKWEVRLAEIYQLALEAGIETSLGKITALLSKPVLSPFTEDWLVTKAGEWSKERMKGFTADIRTAIGDAAARSIELGESYTDIAARVQAEEEGLMTWRAELIARMETSNAFGYGEMETYKATDVGYKSSHWDGGRCDHISDSGILDVCLHNEGLGIIPLDHFYPSAFGDVDGPPYGYNCGCDIFPEENPNGE